jgi:hypothetical protein
MRSFNVRNQLFISNLFGADANNVFFLDGSQEAAMQINQRAEACLESNFFPAFLYLQDLHDISLTPSLLDFIKLQRYTIIGFERISLQILTAIFDHLPPTVTKIGFDWVLSCESINVIRNALVNIKQANFNIEINCGNNVILRNDLLELLKTTLSPVPVMKPTFKRVSRPSTTIIQKHLDDSGKIKQKSRRSSINQRQNLPTDVEAAIFRQQSEVEELRRELEEAHRKKQKINHKKLQSPATITASEDKSNAEDTKINSIVVPSPPPLSRPVQCCSSAFSSTKSTPSTSVPVLPLMVTSSSLSTQLLSALYPSLAPELMSPTYIPPSSHIPPHFQNYLPFHTYTNSYPGQLFSSSCPSSISSPNQTLLSNSLPMPQPDIVPPSFISHFYYPG